MAERVTHLHTHFNTESGHHLVTVSWYDLDEVDDDKRHPIFHESNITAEEALDFARALMTRAEQAMRQQAVDALLGNCKRCGNLRMIEETPPGHRSPMRVHCPACTDNGRSKKALPTMKIWVGEEVSKLDDRLRPKKI